MGENHLASNIRCQQVIFYLERVSCKERSILSNVQDTTIKGRRWCCLIIGERYTDQRKEHLFYTLSAHSLYAEESIFGIRTSAQRNQHKTLKSNTGLVVDVM